MKVSVKLLKEIIKKCIHENEEMLKKLATAKDAKPVETNLANLGIVPIRRGEGEENTSFLGAGAFNNVYDVVYKGKRCVARMSTDKSERDKLLAFAEMKNKLPSQYKKHFPKIFTTFEFDAESAVYGKQTWYGAVVEILDQVEPHLKKSLEMSWLTDKPSRIKISSLQNEALLIKLAKNAILQYAKKMKDVTHYRKVEENELILFFKEEVFPFLTKFDGTVGDLEVDLQEIADKHDNIAFDFFAKEISYFIMLAPIPTHAPNNFQFKDINAGFHSSSKVREFYDFLLTLRSYGAQWGDLHNENFMQRNPSGDLVIVDPGLFTFSE